MLRHRDRAQIVPMSQTTRLIWVGAGTTPCCAQQSSLLSSTEKRFFVSAHPRRNIDHTVWKKSTGGRIDGNPLEQLRWPGCAEEDRQGLCLDTRSRRPTSTSEFRTYFTTTEELLKLCDWLKEQGCTHVAHRRQPGCIGNRYFAYRKRVLKSWWSMPNTSKPFLAERPMSKTPNGSRICCNMACSRPASFLQSHNEKCET